MHPSALRGTRLAAGTLVLALPLAAAAACGVEKSRTIGAEFSSARSNLSASKAASFTLRLDDSKGNLDKIFTKGKNGAPKAISKAVLAGGITYVFDPAGNKTLSQIKTTGLSSSDLKAQLKAVNVAVLVKDQRSTLTELRLVNGTLYAHVDLPEISRLAKAGGVKDFDAQLNDAGSDPTFGKLLADVRAGKWVKLALVDYVEQFKALAKTFTPGAQPAPKPSTKAFDAKMLGRSLYSALKPYVKVTDAADSSTDRVLDVRVQARPAVKAMLRVLKSSKGIPGLSQLLSVDDSAVDGAIADKTVDGTVTLKDGHLTQLAVDLESFRQAAVKTSKDSLAGARLVMDVDDSASPVVAPTDVSGFDFGKIVKQYLDSISALTAGGGATSSGFGFAGPPQA